ncbi:MULTISPECIES: CHAT domain-containing protein [unclassified Coleofasciculus]|uniref:CHAT domain-containing protein n=1 Tax=unclassified Coleofasciculus TaxID=2692782 RepID=UPI00187E76DB|nr:MULTISPECIES: CHAT domain-containing protein [unclassified Coleofasciculus]MBE9127609.1 CHAT domain-containing protein [Coleofasciculus sp. LEGE 07081]MBE9150920.1 CHAT domain-containing protein [Coleofasciculus sp. LEGE 07092]
MTDLTDRSATLAIDEPKHEGANPLPSSKREVQSAIASFPNHNVLSHEQATREAILAALPDHNVLHCSCHGKANLLEPINSGLAMTGQGEAAILTLRDLLDLKLNGIRLVILSACETGLAGTKLADEVISLPNRHPSATVNQEKYFAQIAF